MKIDLPFNDRDHRLDHARRLPARPGSWVECAHRWFLVRVHWWQLGSLERLNDHLLRDIGMDRPPPSRIEAWWQKPPPL
ncbi:hypothetical protein [Microvirga puerhi]|uniref:DUF1127 domain-containing protein n=1 Tax=Microvirga puerhi TaxID=2876078 RepID=A0ABS7VQP2_9HYPH|nr:hypothetical protein [Microvirga puerhi]MBZ6077871.1 hypothetical protein [Microvirga puerhi]